MYAEQMSSKERKNNTKARKKERKLKRAEKFMSITGRSDDEVNEQTQTYLVIQEPTEIPTTQECPQVPTQECAIEEPTQEITQRTCSIM
jgi:hypothetical protein